MSAGPDITRVLTVVVVLGAIIIGGAMLIEYADLMFARLF